MTTVYINKINMLIVIFFTSGCILNNVVFGRFIEETPSSNLDLNSICQPDCSSKIYCVGKDEETEEFTLLHDVQMSGLYKDGTEFVKKEMKCPETEILKKYAELKRNKTNAPSQTDLKEFIENNFSPGTLNNATLTDFNEDPKLLQSVNSYYKDWLKKLNDLWKTFARKMDDSKNYTLSSYIYVPNTFIVAGGRFDEMYYWDSYWIIRGLLACEMSNTSRGIIENIIHLVKLYGYMPNGNRIYYQKRSQPPMLIQMANIYFEATGDEAFIKNNLKTFEEEFKWWYDFRRVQVKHKGRMYHLFRYHAVSCVPRPESYKEDFDLLNKYEPQDFDQKLRIFTGIRSAAESGWDFSSKHMTDPEFSKDAHNGLMNMNPGEYAYVELNSIIHSNVKILAKWKREFGNKQNAYYRKKLRFYEKFSKQMLDTIENVLWNDTEGIWLDYDLMNGKHRNFFYASNFAPLWSKSYNSSKKVNRTIEYLKKYEIINECLDMKPHTYGVPTSASNLNDSEQQWDYPNVWAPLQSFIIRGLQESNDTIAQKVALNLAKAFVHTAYDGYYKNKTHPVMYEKYDVNTLGKEGQKGEYKTAEGFGWTNGLIFEIFSLWPNMSALNASR